MENEALKTQAAQLHAENETLKAQAAAQSPSRLYVRLPEGLHREIVDVAARELRSMAGQIRYYVTLGLSDDLPEHLPEHIPAGGARTVALDFPMPSGQIDILRERAARDRRSVNQQVRHYCRLGLDVELGRAGLDEPEPAADECSPPARG